MSIYEDTFIPLHYKKHAPLYEINKLDLPYYKFCFFRNPWDQFVSMYQYNHDRGRKYLGINYRGSFEEYIKVAVLSPEYGIKTQYGYYKGADKIYKYEELDTAWAEISNKFDLDTPLPHLNKTIHPHYSTYYTDDTRQLVADMCEDEIKLMGYEFAP